MPSKSEKQRRWAYTEEAKKKLGEKAKDFQKKGKK